MSLRTASSKASSKAPAVRALAVRQFTPNGVDSIEREAFVMGAFLKSASALGSKKQAEPAQCEGTPQGAAVASHSFREVFAISLYGCFLKEYFRIGQKETGKACPMRGNAARRGESIPLSGGGVYERNFESGG